MFYKSSVLATPASVYQKILTCSDFFLLFLNMLNSPLFSSSFWFLALPGVTAPEINKPSFILFLFFQEFKNMRALHDHLCRLLSDIPASAGELGQRAEAAFPAEPT